MDIFISAFDEVPDPRADNSRPDLCALLVVAFVAVLCGATSCAEMADFGRAKEHVFRSFPELKHAIMSHDTCSTVFRFIDPKALDNPVTTRITAPPTSPSYAAAPSPSRVRDTSKESLSIKLKRAGWSDAFLLSFLKRLEDT